MTPTRNPHWYPATRLHRGRVPASVRAWLFAGGSLTAHVRARCPVGFRLRILRQRVARPRRDEARLLDIAPGGRALVREIELCCGTQPLVVARTIIPLASLRGRQQRLAGLGRRPLGALLFADRSARREPYQIARLTLRQAGVARPPEVATPVWGRRAVFRLGGAPLLVSEFFLPVLYATRPD
ncbi:MAG: chorismate lyase [Halofilum sp. (in: g-proteobacteria)]